MIEQYINDLCDELDIDVPEVSHDTSIFRTDTTMAFCDGDKIYLRSKKENDPDLLFSIAHELRHLWQIKNDNEFYFSNYKSSDELNTNSYNLQPAEVDANAWASIVMSDLFHLKPLYEGMSYRVITAIQKRIQEILEESK